MRATDPLCRRVSRSRRPACGGGSDEQNEPEPGENPARRGEQGHRRPGHRQGRGRSRGAGCLTRCCRSDERSARSPPACTWMAESIRTLSQQLACSGSASTAPDQTHCRRRDPAYAPVSRRSAPATPPRSRAPSVQAGAVKGTSPAGRCRGPVPAAPARLDGRAARCPGNPMGVAFQRRR